MSENSNKIENDKYVSLSYKLFLNGHDGELVEERDADSPLGFVFGTGLMLPKFEENLEGLTVGDSFTFDLEATDAYGEVEPNAIVDLPINIFERDGKIDEEIIVVGNTVPMQDAQGNRMTGIILEITNEHVKMDFNHPMAGEHLYFSGTIVEVRESTDEDFQSCSCGCDDCETGCDSGCCN